MVQLCTSSERHFNAARAVAPQGWLLMLLLSLSASLSRPQIRAIRRKMVEIMTREATSCDLKELVRRREGLAGGC